VEDDQLKDIIEGCISGKRSAQKALFEEFYGSMLGICLRYTKDKDRAQEVVQEGFIKVFDKLAEFDFTGSFGGWMRRIMVNASIDAIRKRQRSAFLTDEEFILESGSLYEQEEDNDEYLTKLKAKEALEAVQQLSPAYQTVFNLYVIENYSHAEIAQILGISEGSSKSNLAKAKMNLRKMLTEKFKNIDT
jgi:RNA polymerase sigma-70 factor (ECF subfamily)